MMRRRAKHLDHAITEGGSSQIVWDVKSGGVFSCGDEAACAAVSGYLLSRNDNLLQRMPEAFPVRTQNQRDEDPISQGDWGARPVYDSFGSEDDDASLSDNEINEEDIHRCQILHVYQLYLMPWQNSLTARVERLRLSLPVQIFCTLLLPFCAFQLFLFGSYVLAAVFVWLSIIDLISMGIVIRRPSIHLGNDESRDASILVAAHQNANEWHLYNGDRAIIHSLLNKPMFLVPARKAAASTFSLAGLIQLGVMTYYAAAQTGWEELLMVAVVAIHRALRLSPFGTSPTQNWLEREGVDTKVRSFEFEELYAMVGAIQLFSQSSITCWMDEIIAPHPRREAWLKSLKGEEPTEDLSGDDRKWLEYVSNASFTSTAVLKRAFDDGDSGTTQEGLVV